MIALKGLAAATIVAIAGIAATGLVLGATQVLVQLGNIFWYLRLAPCPSPLLSRLLAYEQLHKSIYILLAYNNRQIYT